MEQILELTLNTTTNRFEQWIRQFVPSSIPYYSLGSDGVIIPAVSSDGDFTPIIIDKDDNKFIKFLGSPYLKDDSQGLRLYEVHLAVGALDSLEKGEETETSLPLLKIFETKEGKTSVLIPLTFVDLYPYIKDLNQEIARLWPETKRTISALETINWRYLEMDNLLFEGNIEAEPMALMEWIHSEIGKTWPQEVKQNINLPDNKSYEISSSFSGDYFPPDDSTTNWDYIIYVHDKNIYENGAFEGFSGAIARIQLSPIVANRFHLKYLCGSYHPKVLKWMEEIKDKLVEIYQPVEAIATNEPDEKVDEQSNEKKSKRGPHKYSKKEKIQAVEEWDSLEPGSYSGTLEDWLEQKFGTSYGVLNVKSSTFHGWRKQINS
jgi:hypothetical protein